VKGHPKARADALRPLLLSLDATLDRAGRLAADPVELPRRHADPHDQEVAALVAVSLAYGRADVFKPLVVRMLARMGPTPARFAEAFARAPDPAAFEGLAYRFNRPPDLAALVAAIGHVRNAHGSLGARFAALYRSRLPPPPRPTPPASRGRWEDGDLAGPGSQAGPARLTPRRVRVAALRSALAAFAADLRDAPPVGPLLAAAGRPRRGLRHLLPDPGGPGASKRWNLYLRWMIRGPDAVDLGAWAGQGVPRSALVVPLDTHVHRVARALGLTRRRDASWRTAEEITRALARVDPEDPVRFDFALCHLGMSGRCPARRDPGCCQACPLLGACAAGRRVVRIGPPPSPRGTARYVPGGPA
jgi:hypothetical protein